ncbi:MAG: polyhydroxyalkanoate synthesis repressor PhaR [Rhodospirillales bacterium]|nr:MAG: polyhydroxyalkanoate synthesis repressor PhaR [Rhodospirillales bacterium]
MNESSTAAARASTEPTPVTIKKYANRRLYNTATSSYVTLQSLATMVKAGSEFVVYDAKTGEDITRSVLTHIIVEEEAKGQKLLPVSFLRHLISFYGDSLQVLVPRYLEHTMQAFARNQEQMRDYMRDTLDGLMPFGQLEEVSKQNISIFETAMKMFSPFYSEDDEDARRGDRSAARTPNQEIEELRGRLNKIQQQLDELVSQQRSD